jgi:putative heme-binding domain-containing protein
VTVRSLRFGVLAVCVFWLAATSDTAADELPSVLPGFKVELLRSAQPGGDSWVCMTSDAKGRLVISPQGPGGYLIQVTLSPDGQVGRMQKIDRPTGSAMGLAYAFDSLYVDGDGPKGFGVYRLHYDPQTDQYGWPALITKFPGYPPHEHGAHGIVPGKDGHLYITCGDFVGPPPGLTRASPLRNYGIDQLLPPDGDPDGFGAGLVPPAGFVLRVGPNGEDPELFGGGLRNVYAIAFNADGELFGFDNDPNNDLGLPWYRPNALYHLVSGADYGYREGSAKWPQDYPDSWPALVETGLGCPTGLKFGDRGNFPGKYKNALYALDWCAGRILAMYLTPEGATYQGGFSTFVQGKPLNVTDLEFAGDGSMYFITGGRKTQSSLYRVSYVGPPEGTEPAAHTAALNTAGKARKIRQALEGFQASENPDAVRLAWPYLDSEDRFIRAAARLAIEKQPVAAWQSNALAETRTNASLTALLALARCGGRDSQPLLLERLSQWPLRSLNSKQQLAKLRVIELSFIRQGRPQPALSDAVRKELDGQYPSSNSRLNPELCQILVYLQAADVAGKTLALLDAATTQEEQIRYIYGLRMLQLGWTIEQRKHYFAWFNQRAADEAAGSSHPHSQPPPSAALEKWFADAGRSYSDGSSLSGYLANFRQEPLDSLTAAERVELGPWLASNAPVRINPPAAQQRPFLNNWAVDDLLVLLAKSRPDNRSITNGKEIFISAGCSQCHRFAGSGGAVGPDLTAISSSNSRRDILESILDPSKVIADQYRNATIVTKDGDELVGRIVGDTPSEIALMTDAVNRTIVKMRKADIQKREFSKISPMPQGLMNSYGASEILDLLAYLESGLNQPPVSARQPNNP